MSEPASDANKPAAAAADEVVPRLPRGRGMRLSRIELFRIAGLALVLVVLLVMQRPCASAVSTFVTGFGDRGSAAAVMPRPDTLEVPGATAGSAAGSGSAVLREQDYEHLRPGMTEAETKAAIERARRKASGSAAQ